RTTDPRAMDCEVLADARGDPGVPANDYSIACSARVNFLQSASCGGLLHAYPHRSWRNAKHCKYLSCPHPALPHRPRGREAHGAARKHGRYGHRDATMILLAYRHGLRASELCDLQWHQVEINTGRLHVRRSKKSTPSVHPTRSLKIDDQLEFGRLRHRQVGRLGALQDAPGIGADLTITVFKVRPVARQSADCHKITPRISRRNPAARRQGGKLHGPADEECIGNDEESSLMLTP